MLNVPTLFVALFAAFAMFGLTLAVVQRSLPDCPELVIWARGTWITLAAFALLVTRSFAPEWIAIVGGNALLFVGVHLYRHALYRFVRGHDAPRWQMGLTAAGIACTVAMLNYPLSQRTSAISLLYALQVLPLVALLLRFGWRQEASLRTVGASLLLMTIALVLRAAHAALRPEEYTGYFQASIGNGATYLASFLFPLGAGIGFILANLERTAGKLRGLATFDSLTGCMRRGPFELLLQNTFERARRKGEPLSLLLLDLDDFKRINDSHGHQAGDEALRKFAVAARSRLRASDSLGRVGGEEFAVLLPDTGAVGAMTLAEELRAATEAIVFEGRDGLKIGVTVSVGAANTSAVGAQSWKQLYGQADTALYEAKQSGKNRASHFEPGMASP